SITILSYDIPNFPALLDSGSSDCFIDTNFVTKNKNKTYSILPILLFLFNGTSNSYITKAVDLSVCFPTGDITSTTFYVTPLDSTCSLLTCYNLLVDWVLGSITFRSIQQQVPTPPMSPPQPLESPPPIDSTSTDMPHFSDCKAPHIALINAAAFALACHLEGSMQFSLHLCSEESKLCATSAKADPVDLSTILPDYHDFTDVFSKSKASQLAPHHEHDLKIDLEEGASSLLRTMYSLFTTKLDSLYTFLDKHLTNSFIHPSSTHAAPVLFIHKKDSSLHLCVDF
ncbi:hypothetical protein PAXRUDRAFT_158530, partial [Paxillus rubicundulus Ve08.2h10]